MGVRNVTCGNLFLRLKDGDGIGDFSSVSDDRVFTEAAIIAYQSQSSF